MITWGNRCSYSYKDQKFTLSWVHGFLLIFADDICLQLVWPSLVFFGLRWYRDAQQPCVVEQLMLEDFKTHALATTRGMVFVLHLRKLLLWWFKFLCPCLGVVFVCAMSHRFTSVSLCLVQETIMKAEDEVGYMVSLHSMLGSETDWQNNCRRRN